MLEYMWLLGKFNSTLLEEKKYLLLPLDNPSLMINRKRRSIRRESRFRNQSQLKCRRNLSRRRIERDGVKRKILPQTRHPLTLILTRPLRWNKRKHLRLRTNDLEPVKKVSFLSLAFIYRISLVASHLDFQ